MASRRRQPPSRARYAARHPTIGVHCDLETYQRAAALRERSGLSFGQLFKQELGLAEKDTKRARALGYAEGLEAGRRAGYAEARNLYRLTYPCFVCRRPMEVSVDSEEAKIAVAAITARGWGHDKC
jgi:hypothetical protein